LKSLDGGEADKGKLAQNDETLKLAGEFAAKVPKLEFSPAEIMSILLANKESPRQAIDNVDAWVEKARKKLKRQILGFSMIFLKLAPDTIRCGFSVSLCT
jgi:hypothetical protein